MAKKKKSKKKVDKSTIWFIPLSEKDIGSLNEDFYELEWSMGKLFEYLGEVMNDNCQEHFENMIDRYENIAKVLNARSDEVGSPLEVDQEITYIY